MNRCWQANIQAIRKRDPALADRLEATEPAEVTFEPARREEALAGWVATTGGDGRARRITLASRHAPLAEARALAEQADLDAHAVVLMLGVGLGHHVTALAERLAGHGVVVAYEPSLPILRAVLERADLAPTLGARHVTLFAGEPDSAFMTRRLEPHVAQISQGVQILTHPPTRQMAGPQLNAFTEQFTRFVAYTRTNITTTLVNSAATCRNQAHNLGRYAAGETINPLAGVAAGRPAVCVAAGPSLARNVDLLARPGMRDRVVIIAVQTVLKPLLARGIRPHFVTALDYHEISRRFYDDLPDLPDVTLIAEPKANKAILDYFPGPIRVCRSSFLDTLLGPLIRPVHALPAGSTVAHLSLYLAQHLGCDPIIFIGQDLGFSDGLYYAPGTAIHDVWAPELSPFNTLEMMEWKRVARHRRMLRPREDIHGRPIYTDEQMLTYLRQFERDFAAAPQQIIDATEGGLPKADTQRMTLTAALERYADRPLPPLPEPRATLDRARLAATADHLARRTTEVARLAQASRDTLPLLLAMLDHQRNPDKMQRLFKKLDRERKTVAQLQDAFALVNELNQIGAFKRARADRAIGMQPDLDAYERQRRQLERDIENVEWLIDGCEQTLEMFGEAAARIDGQLAEARRTPPTPVEVTL